MKKKDIDVEQYFNELSKGIVSAAQGSKIEDNAGTWQEMANWDRWDRWLNSV